MLLRSYTTAGSPCEGASARRTFRGITELYTRPGKCPLTSSATLRCSGEPTKIAEVINGKLKAGTLVISKPVALPHFRRHPDGRLEALATDAPELIEFKRRLREITARVNGR